MSRLRTASTTKLALIAGVAGVGLLLTGVGVYAALQATASNATPEAINSATLKLTLAGAGFTTAVGNLVPGDVTNRYVDLTNGGTSAA